VVVANVSRYIKKANTAKQFILTEKRYHTIYLEIIRVFYTFNRYRRFVAESLNPIYRGV